MRSALLALSLIAVSAPAWAGDLTGAMGCDEEDPWCLAQSSCVETVAVSVTPADPNGQSSPERQGYISFANGKGLSYSGSEGNGAAKAVQGKPVKVCRTGAWDTCPTNFHYSVTDKATGRRMPKLYAVSHCLMPPPKG